MEWITLREFMKRNKIGYEKAIKLINENKVEYQKSEIGTYRIKVSNSEKDSEFVRNLIEENTRLKEKIELMKKIVN